MVLVSIVLGCAVLEPGAGGLNTVNCSSVHVRVFFLDPIIPMQIPCLPSDKQQVVTGS